MSDFLARFSSRCPSCDSGIREGDVVRWSDDVVVHADCDDMPDQKPLPDPCGDCFMVPAANGSCGCDA